MTIDSLIIPQRVEEFLKKTPPFYHLSEQEFLEVAGNIKISYHNKNQKLFSIDEKPSGFFYLIERGAVKTFSQDGAFTGEYDEGEIIGIAPYLRNDNYKLNAIISEEALLYEIPWPQFQRAMQTNAKIALYLASGFAAGTISKFQSIKRPTDSINSEEVEVKIDEKESPLKSNFFEANKDISDIIKEKVFSVAEDVSVIEIANLMLNEKIGSVLVVSHQNYPIGLITKSDFIKSISKNSDLKNLSAKDIMHSPVRCSKLPMRVSDALLEIIQNKQRHFVLTKDGTSNSEVIGIFSEHDLLVSQGHNPAVLLKEIKKAKNVEQLRNIKKRSEKLLYSYLNQNASSELMMAIATQILDEIICQIIELNVTKMTLEFQQKIQNKWAFICFGSHGRRELVVSGDQDNGIVYHDDLEEYKKDFLKLGESINFDIDMIGIKYCPYKIMASNEFWTRSESDWGRQISKWSDTPTGESIMHLLIFYDFRLVFGNKDLVSSLEDKFKNFSSTQSQITFYKIVKDALKSPVPLNFFRNFIVEKGGEHVNEFDIKARALLPIIDFSRVMTMHYSLCHKKSTIDRLVELMKADPKKSDLYQSLITAFAMLQKYKMKEAFNHKNSGRYIETQNLTKIQKQQLRSIFMITDDAHRFLKTKFPM